MTWTGRFTALSSLCAAVVSASCAGRDERGTSTHDTVGATTQDAAPDAVVASATDASGGLPPTSSLFLAIDDMQMHPGVLPPPPTAGFWWMLGPLGNWNIGSAGADPTLLGDSPSSDIVPPARASCLQSTCWSRHVQADKLASGLDLSAQLKHPQGGAVDLSSFAGIAFWARLASPSGRLIVTLRDGDPSNPYVFLSAESSGSPWFAQSLAVSDQWERFILLFDDFHQGVISGNNSRRTLNTAAITNIDFVVGLGGESFDLLIHDLALFCRGVCPTVPCPFALEEGGAGRMCL